MRTKDDFIKALRNNPQYRSALKMAKDDAERKKIITTVEGFVAQFASVLAPVIEKATTDNVFASELRQALKNGGRVVNVEERQPVSGSVV